jgi:hypothetical protein
MRARAKKREGKPMPVLGDYTPNVIGKKGERRTSKLIGGTLTPGSGKGRMKGDVLHGYKKEGRVRERGFKRMIEKKSTKGKSIKIEEAWLTKLEQQAFAAGKEPVLVIEFETMQFGSKQWGCVPLEKLKEYFDLEDSQA